MVFTLDRYLNIVLIEYLSLVCQISTVQAAR